MKLLNEDLPPKVLADAAGIIRSFIEDYHSKLEEDYLFPRFKKANKLVDLIDVLFQQHQAGRRLTDVTLRLAKAQAIRAPEDRRALAEPLRLFVRMYNPHAAREDTALFPAFRQIVSANEYGSLGEDFERREHELFGKDGFEEIVGRVTMIEKSLGIFDLSQFTRLAAMPLLINISVAIFSTKVPILLGHGYWMFALPKLTRYGFWSMMHEARTDFSMWMGLVFLLIVGAGSISCDAMMTRRLHDGHESSPG